MNVAMVMAKLSGVRKALDAVLTENVSRNRSQGEVLLRRSYQPDVVQHYFTHAHELISDLRLLLPDLYADFQQTEVEPNTEVVPAGGGPYIKHFGDSNLSGSRATSTKCLRFVRIPNWLSLRCPRRAACSSRMAELRTGVRSRRT